MANVSGGFTPRRSSDPSNKKFTFKKPGTRPFSSGISDTTPFLSTNDRGHTSTENPCQVDSRGFISTRSDSSGTKTVPTGEESGSGHVTSNESEGIIQNSNKVCTSKTPQYGNRGLQRRHTGQHNFPNFEKETPFLHASARQNLGTINGTTSGNDKQANSVSSAYFSKSTTCRFQADKGKKQKKGALSSSSLMTGSVSASSEADSVVAMETETEGDLSMEDVDDVHTVERPENSMSVDTQFGCCSDLTFSKICHDLLYHCRHFYSSFMQDKGTQIYMGVMWHGGRLSVAYYDIDLTVIYMMLDAVESEEFKLLHRVITQVNPTQIILSSKQDERLIQMLKSYGRCLDSDTSMTDTCDEGPFQLQFLPSIDFALEICKRRVLSLELPSIPSHYTDTERTLYFSSLVPFENVCMVRAVGGLLKYLEKLRVGVELEEAGVRVPVLALKTFTLEDQMILDDTAYSALQIFHRESHPSAYKVGTSNSGKEGLSLFGIMNKTRSPIGSRMLRTWFQRPLKNLEILKQRHDAISFFVNPRHMEVVRTLEDSVRHVKNTAKILTRMVQSQASVGDWQALYKTVLNAGHIKEVCRVQTQSIEIFRKITESFSDDLNHLGALINKIVDFPESTRQCRFVVQPKVDKELDEKKQLFSGLPDMMSAFADKEKDQLEAFNTFRITYLPQIGYMIAVSEADILVQVSKENGYKIEGLDFMFSSNNMLYYKSPCTRELDGMLGDIKNDITDIETGIMHDLQSTIVQHTDVLLAVLDHTAELDCLLSLAACAREFDYVRPTLTLDNVIEVTGGRHAIQEMCCNTGTFVSNDILSNEEYGKIIVLTGPNACGKSVYLKQVAVIVFLAQVGSFVPAESATLGLMDRIFTRIRSLESVSTGLSTFMIDINQMAEAMRSATEKSLCIIDEFGKGTDMIDGLSLLCACLSYWVSEVDCPHVFVSTHFHSIIHQHLLPKSPAIKYLTLETLNNGEELVFLYQLTEGHTSSSFACHIAAQVGIPQDVVRRGEEVSELIRQCRPISRADSAGIETQFKKCSTIVNRFLDLDLDTADVKSFFEELVLPTAGN